MYNIIYKDESLIIIRKFSLWYINSFISLYSDSGLENELEILQNYDKIWYELRKEIKTKINDNLSQKEVFWYKLLNWEKSIKIYLKSFMLEIYFEEDEKEKIRFIEKIIINKK